MVEISAKRSLQLNYIPLPRDDQYQVWLSYQAKARGVHTIVADSWSADGYMKTTGGYIVAAFPTRTPSRDLKEIVS